MSSGKVNVADWPKLDFTTFVVSLRQSAMVHLGDAPGPEGSSEQDLELAWQDIELLALLHEKTKGNLTGEEERILDEALDEMRERFEEVSSA
ncbi:MAG: DUF1844 domain-containing protein [Polyangiaceae bacterium]|nr:DUF1844 domain-containing protein [Polyangiaceae bacterium]